MTAVFLYGTLCDAGLLRIVAGGTIAARPARLEDHEVRWARDAGFPLIRPAPGAVAEGLLVEPSGEQRARLDFYEMGFGYRLFPVEVLTDRGHEQAMVYFPEPGRWAAGAEWSLPDWQAGHGPLAREAAEEYMRLYGHLAPERAAEVYPQVLSRAASRLRARAHPSPQAFPPAHGLDDVKVFETDQPYTDYFAVREDRLSFRRFDGSESPPVRRASFMGGDAVTVLPYDPARGTVMMIRQFRHGAFCRGDPNPWCLEPPAGRIDPGETPEEAAARELAEETGLTARVLHRVAAYYPTPGAFSEYLTSYVAECDLSGAGGRVGGVAGEDEDILTHIVTFEEAFALIANGAVNTGPLLLSLIWLAAEREHPGGAG